MFAYAGVAPTGFFQTERTSKMPVTRGTAPMFGQGDLTSCADV